MAYRNMSAVEVEAIRQRIRAELCRRSGKDSSGNDINFGDKGHFFGKVSDRIDVIKETTFETQPVKDELIDTQQGAAVIDPLLEIEDFGDLVHVLYGDPIPNAFDYDQINAHLSKLESENYDAPVSSCRSGCMGLCVGMCGNTCKSNCNDACTSCEGSCSIGCLSACTGCTETCGATCGAGCSQTCKNTATDCGATCASGCGSGCKGNCDGCTGCYSCTGLCAQSCTGTCINACNNTEHSKCISCSTQCVGACGNSCQGTTTKSTSIRQPGAACTTCSKLCAAGCTTSCEMTCEGNCYGTCNNTCVGDCNICCSGECTGYCRFNCTGACVNNCANFCQETCLGCDNTCKDACTSANTAAAEAYNWKIRLYKYGTLYKMLRVRRGYSSILGTCSADPDDSFVGWSNTNTSTDVAYDSNTEVTPTADMAFHAVYEYDDIEHINSPTVYEIVSEKNKIVNVMFTFNSDQTITLKARYSANNTWTW